MRSVKKPGTLILSSFLLAIFSVSIFIVLIGKANAFTVNYNSSNLIDDPTFLNNSAMSESAIQAFLTNIGSGLANFSDVEACGSAISSYYPSCGQTVSAAQIVYDASQAYKINPRVILATLEKEQSLVTDPSPLSSQLNCAMGYNSCTGYVGFFTQVDNGAWQLRFSYERANGDSTWWNPSLSYPCANASSLYSAGLIPGNTVTFADPGGTAETITIANAATAALYCYTPYVGPYSVTGYSGTYNFVYYYQLWFGSTLASSPYVWAVEGQGSYTDSGYSDPITGDIYMAPGQTAYLTVDARNIGYDTWQKNMVYLSTDRPAGGSSPFYNAAWNSPGTIAMQQSSTAPGNDATFQFPVTAPSQTGTYKEYFTMVAEGAAWLNDPGLYFTINVVQPQNSTPGPNNELVSGQSLSPGQYILSPETQSALKFYTNGDVILYADGKAIWGTGVNNTNANKFIMQTDGNLVEYTSGGQALWSSGKSGSNTYLSMQSDGNLVEYTSGGQALWSSGTSANPSNDYRVDQTIPSGGVLFPGQTIENASKSCQLVFQANGNLVEYNSSNQVIWASNTAGKNSALLAMQPDGNLVIYNTTSNAIWASSTFLTGASLVVNPSGGFYLEGNGGNGELFAGESLQEGQVLSVNNYSLVMQYDGNLVLYGPSGGPVWSSGTSVTGSAYAVMQTDGNLVIYKGAGGAAWSSGTGGPSPSILALQTDGNLVIYNAKGPVWSSGTVGK